MCYDIRQKNQLKQMQKASYENTKKFTNKTLKNVIPKVLKNKTGGFDFWPFFHFEN